MNNKNYDLQKMPKGKTLTNREIKKWIIIVNVLAFIMLLIMFHYWKTW